MQTFHIFGSGGIGQAALLMLHTLYDDARFVIYDRNFEQFDKIFENADSALKNCIDKSFVDLSKVEKLTLKVEGKFVLDCMPGSFAPKIAKTAIEAGIHYINLTEYVSETEQIIRMTSNSDKSATVLQSGVAPGFVNLLGKNIVEKVKVSNKFPHLKHLEMKVGALPINIAPPSHYAFTWSTIGVATEYVQDAKAVVNHELVDVPSLDKIHTLVLNETPYECALTSGGVADIAETFKTEIENIDYHTIRHPGHFGWVKENLSTVNGTNEKKIDHIHQLMLDHVPFEENDQVLIYANLTYTDDCSKMCSHNELYEVNPNWVAGIKLRGIQISTAAPMIATIDWILNSGKSGLITQSMIDTDFILSHPLIKRFFVNVKQEELVGAL